MKSSSIAVRQRQLMRHLFSALIFDQFLTGMPAIFTMNSIDRKTSRNNRNH